MPNIQVNYTSSSRDVTDVLIDGEVATAEIVIALMIQMESARGKETNVESISYYTEGIGELTFTPERKMTQERINYLLQEGNDTRLRVGNKKNEESGKIQ
ncbi:hypothetical protein LD13_gp085 [Bacillus phage Bobb]|uniref:Uncharacterized protein n=1 Tax=Bacillus phage Bobb TaxID=1527469 RepID=A0A076G7A0_9CAUD|nr:hypothetical protein LD13_gp085 [Bacillus phage Bobb]AII27986.1 hypothetical protein [Bacillus phage Bobb]